MMNWLRGIKLTGESEARRRRRRVDRRLRAEVSNARIEPSPDLRRRTIAALNDAVYQPGPPMAVPRPGGATYAVALLALLVLGAIAVRLGVVAPTRPVPVVEPTVTRPFDPTVFDKLIRAQLQQFEGTWETSLRTEARLIATDARNAGEYVLATLPLPASWSIRARPEG